MLRVIGDHYVVFTLSLFTLASLGLAACDLVSEAGLHEGERLEAVSFSAAQPTSREAFALLATFTVPGRIAIVRPDSVPELVKIIRIPGLLTWDAKLDRDGYLWVMTPDVANRGGSHRRLYIVDPHTSRVHRVVNLPSSLRSSASLALGATHAYVFAWRDGFSFAIGAIQRSNLQVRRLSGFDSTGNFSGEEPIRVLGGAIYVSSSPSSRGGAFRTDRLMQPSGPVVNSIPLSGVNAVDRRFMYVLGFQPRGTQNVCEIHKVELETLRDVAVVEAPGTCLWIAQSGGKLYLVRRSDLRSFEVRSAETLALEREVVVADAGAITALFGFLTPDLLMLNEHAYYNVRTGALQAQAFPLNESFSQALRRAEGKELY